MKKLLVIVIICLIALGTAAIALAGPNGDEAIVEVGASVGPYASVKATKLEYDHTNCWWLIFWEKYWGESDALMDFGWFTGAPGYNKIKDTNCFIVETNDVVNVDFTGIPLTHTNGVDKLPTKYWAFASKGYDEDTWPLPLWQSVPDQLVPWHEIGFFGEGNAPVWNGLDHFDVPEWEDLLLTIGALRAWPDVWPDDNEISASTMLHGKGIYPFQVFGFAGTGANISSQEAGSYEGTIFLTVSVAEAAY